MYSIYSDELLVFSLRFSLLDKSYDTAEEDDFRMKVFTENKYRIAKHNVGRHLGHHNYTLEMNNYGDMLPHEFKGLMNGYRYILHVQSNLVIRNFLVTLELLLNAKCSLSL